ncbi:hypothetical protein ACQPZZ_15310 [Microbispora sp. CA-135349]|uniref:hypothetical protein n=1 Tax=Microbispora sp. CA-135349 TaxID=3239953 RepID=UPI003D94F4C0
MRTRVTSGFHAFLTRPPYEPAFGREDPVTIVGRYRTHSLEYRIDGSVDAITRAVES